MKRIISISLGSSQRDHASKITVFGQEFSLQRIGTNGCIDAAISLIRQYDGIADAFGMGGIDLYLFAGRKRYAFRDAKRIAKAAVKTPLVDGSGLKNTLERNVVEQLNSGQIPLSGKRVLMVSSVDRFGMTEALVEAGAEVMFGDIMFGLGLPIPVRSYKKLKLIARLTLPVLTQLPFKWMYPTGTSQDSITERYENHYQWADIIAGDFNYIKRYMPKYLKDKIILTNTVTSSDIQELRKRGVSILVTTTPHIQGRSYGTNIMEAILIAFSGKRPEQMHPEDYISLLGKAGFSPFITKL